MVGVSSSAWNRACSGLLAAVLLFGPALEVVPAFATEDKGAVVTSATELAQSAEPTDGPVAEPLLETEDEALRPADVASPTLDVVEVEKALPSAPGPAAESSAPTLVRELTEKRTRESTHWLYTDGSIRAEISQAPVRFMDEDGLWREISTDLVVGSSYGTVESVSTEMTTTLGPQCGDAAPVTLTTDDYSVGIDYLGAAEQAKVVYGDTTRYLDVATDTDLEYRVLPEGVKETVVLKSIGAPSTHTFRVSLEGLELRNQFMDGHGLYRPGQSTPELDLGELVVFDSSQDAAGNPQYCAAATMSVVAIDSDEAEITYSLPKEWLEDSDRVFPVHVDPTITKSTELDTFVSSKYPSTTYNTSTELKCGYYDSTTGHNRSYVRFDTSSIPQSAYVADTNFAIRQFSQYYNGTQTTTTYLGRLLNSFSEGTTWNSQSSAIGDPQAKADMRRGKENTSENVTLNWDVDNIVQTWVETPSSNKGFFLYQSETSSQNTTHWRKFRSKEYSVASERPSLEVWYLEPSGVSGTGANKTSVREGETIKVSFQINTYRPEDINIVELQVKDGSGVDRGLFRWSTDANTAGGTTALEPRIECPGTAGGWVTVGTADGRPYIQDWSAHEYVVDQDHLRVEFTYTVPLSYGTSNVTNNKLEYRFWMGPTNAAHTFERDWAVDDDRWTVVNDALPVASGSATPRTVILGSPITFSGDGSTDDMGSIKSYAWDFDRDGTIDSTAKSPTYTYPTPGLKSWSLAVTDVRGQISNPKCYGTVTVLPDASPVASGSATPITVILGAPVTFSSTGSTDDVGISSYAWDFDNNGTIDSTSSATPKYTYTTAGVKTWKLTVTDKRGQSSTASGTAGVAPSRVTSLSVETTASGGWFKESVNPSSGALVDENNWPDKGRGSIIATWAPATGALGYKILLSDGNAEREIGRTFGSQSTTFTTSGLGIYHADEKLAPGTFGPTQSPFGSSPLAAQTREQERASGVAGTGVVVTYGSSLYVKDKWSSSAVWRKMGSGLQGSSALGEVTAQVGAASGNLIMSAFLRDGFIYEGYAVTPTQLAGIAIGESAVSTSTMPMNFNAPLLQRHAFSSVAAPTHDIIVTADERAVYSVAHDRSRADATFKIRKFAAPSVLNTATYDSDHEVALPGVEPFVNLESAFVADNSLYLVEWGGAARIVRVDMRSWKATGLWSVDGGSTQKVSSACFDPVSRSVFAGTLGTPMLYRYSGPGFDLRDNPQKLYGSTPGTATDNTDGYFLRVVPFNAVASDPATITNTGAWRTLDTRTVKVDQDPRHTVYDLGGVAGAGAKARLESGARALTLDVTDLSVASWGPDVQLTRHYSSADTSTVHLAPGWHFGFEQRLANVSAESTRVVYIDEDQELHTFITAPDGTWQSPNGYVADIAFFPKVPLITVDDRWTLTFKDRTVLTFDSSGRIMSETDSNNQTAAYDFEDDVVTITAANGQSIEVSLSNGIVTSAVYVAGSEHRRVDYDTSQGTTLTVGYFPVTEDAYSIAYGYSDARVVSAEIEGHEFAGATARWDFEYGPAGRVETVTQPALRQDEPRPQVSIAYSAESSLETTLDVATVTRSATVSGTPDTPVLQRFASNPCGTMAYMTNERTADEREVSWTYSYSPANEVVSELSPTAKGVSRVFDSRSNVLFDYDEERHLNVYEYDEYDRLGKHIDPRGCATYSTYETATGNLLTTSRVLNHNENTTSQFEYDDRGLTTLARTQLTDDRWLTTLNSSFSDSGQPRRTEVVAQVSSDGGATFTDAPISLGATATVASIVTTSSVDEFGQVLSQTDAGGLVTMKDAVYSPAGKLKRSTDVDGVVTHYAYDALGNLKETSQTVDATTGPSFAEWHRYEVDAYGRTVRESDLGVGGAESTWVKHVFDPSGNEAQTVDSLEGTTTTWYDARGNTLAQWAPDVNQSDPQAASRWVFDADGVELAEIEAGKPDSDAIKKQWRPDGLLLKVIDADGSWMRYEYDDGGNQTAEISPTEEGAESAERTYYDVGGRVICQESSDGMKTNTSYDLAGRPLRVYTTNAVETGEEDEEGEPILATVETTTSAMSYNELGWILASTGADGIRKTSVYDVLGNTAEASVWASGATSPTSVTSFDYDTQKRVVRQAVTEAGKENIVQYSYDPFGRVISEVHSKSGKVSRDIATDYDEFGRETRVGDNETGVVSRYVYAGGGKKRSTSNLTYGSTSVTSTVDAIGRETTQAATIALPHRTVDIEREVSWNLTKNLPQSATVRIDGVAKTMIAEFDDTDRLRAVTGGLWGTGGLSMTYDRGDGTGKGTGAKLTDSVSFPWDGGYSTTSRTFGFTPSGRISTVTAGEREINYSWDASGTGDLLKVKDGTITTTFANKDGHVATATTGALITTFDYDATGRRTKETAGSSIEDYTWVGDDSLASWKRTVSGSTAASATYTYDGDGQRMRADVFSASPLSTTPTDTAYTYGWDGLTLRWMKGQSAGASSTIEYLSYGDGRAYAGSYVATRGAETTSAIFQLLSSDHGDIVALADETGEVFARYAYGPYGEAEGITTRQTGKVSESLAAEIAAAQPLRYAGYCYDTWSGDYYLQARYYDASTKQFISKDPAEADGEQSAYQYCAGDPVHSYDPTGLAADYSGAGRQTVLNSTMHAAKHTKNKKLKTYYLSKARQAEKAERAQRAYHQRLVAQRKAAEKRAARAKAKKAAARARIAAKKRRAAALRAGASKTAAEEREARMLAGMGLAASAVGVGVGVAGIVLLATASAPVLAGLMLAGVTASAVGWRLTALQDSKGYISPTDAKIGYAIGVVGVACPLAAAPKVVGVTAELVLGGQGVVGSIVGVGTSGGGLAVEMAN